MAHFLPRDNAEAARLTKELSETMFRSPVDFVTFYNSGLVNKKNPEVMRIVARLREVYRDIEERSGNIIFLTKEEIYLEEIQQRLDFWLNLSKVKREIVNAVDNQLISGDTIIILREEQPTVFFLNDENEVDKLGYERTFKFESVFELQKTYSSIQEQDDESFYFKASDFLNLDDHFVEEIYQIIPR